MPASRRLVPVLAALAVCAGALACPSAASAATSQATRAPAVKVRAATATTVTLSWSKNSSARSWAVYRAVGGGAYKKVATVAGSRTTWKNTKLSVTSTYSYKVRAVLAGGKLSPAGAVVKKIRVRGDYSAPSLYGAKLNAEELARIRDTVANFVNVKQTWRMTQAERVGAALEFVARTEYRDWQDNRYYNTAYGSLVLKKGACSAFTRGYLAVCDAMGGTCKPIHARTSDHQWIHQKIDGSWWRVDAQEAKILHVAHPGEPYPLIKVKASVSPTSAAAKADAYLSYYVMTR